MTKFVSIFFITCTLIFGSLTIQVWAQEKKSDEWEVIVVPYLWAISLNGDAGIKGRPAKVDAGFKDVVENSKSILGFEGVLEVRKGKWGAFVDGTYLDIKLDTVEVRRLEADLRSQMGILKFGAAYRVVTKSLADVPGGSPGYAEQKFWLDVVAGGRYTYLKNKLDLSLGPLSGSPSLTKDWVDPFVGLRTSVDLTRKVRFSAEGNLGGFGAGSDISAEVYGVLGYKFTAFNQELEVLGGYRGLYQDYTDGRFTWKMWLHGPITGLKVAF